LKILLGSSRDGPAEVFVVRKKCSFWHQYFVAKVVVVIFEFFFKSISKTRLLFAFVSGLTSESVRPSSTGSLEDNSHCKVKSHCTSK